jgi:hypothetical protein
MRNYPVDAEQITFKPITGKRVTYYIWHKTVAFDFTRWYWYAMGQCGYEHTREEAMDAARRYLTEGYQQPHSV